MQSKKLPKLRKISYKNKKHKYHINDSSKKRHLAIDEGINKGTKKNKKLNAKAKKSRFNLLRIYRKYKDPKACKILTKDMIYIDKKYKVGKTNQIC